jgi:hypothetical protein
MRFSGYDFARWVAAAAFYILALAAQLSGFTSSAIAWALAVVATLFLGWSIYHFVLEWHRSERQVGRRGVEPWHFLAVGLVGTWLFMTIALGAVGWMIWRGGGLGSALGAAQVQEEGPLRWFYNLTLDGGFGRNVYALTFAGTNASQGEVRLKEAHIRSAINGAELALEVDAGKDGTIPIDQISLVPPGAPIKLIAKFNLPEGIPPAEFVATWGKFSLVVKDDTREYRVPFNEGHIAVFFPGMVGPHISKKAAP